MLHSPREELGDAVKAVVGSHSAGQLTLMVHDTQGFLAARFGQQKQSCVMET